MTGAGRAGANGKGGGDGTVYVGYYIYRGSIRGQKTGEARLGLQVVLGGAGGKGLLWR